MASSFVRGLFANTSYCELAIFSKPTSFGTDTNCWDNAVMENFFGHLKQEAIKQHPNPTFEEAKQLIDDYIHFYNYERIQLKTRQTPYQLRCLSQ